MTDICFFYIRFQSMALILQGEREAKYAMKKELDNRINSESMYNLSNLAFSIRGTLTHLYVFLTSKDHF